MLKLAFVFTFLIFVPSVFSHLQPLWLVPGDFKSPAFSGDGRRIGVVRELDEPNKTGWEWQVYDAKDGRQLQSWPIPLLIHPRLASLDFPSAFATNQAELLTYTEGETHVLSRDIRSGSTLRRYWGAPRNVGKLLSAHSAKLNINYVIAVGPHETVVWDQDSGKEIHRFPRIRESRLGWAGTVSPDGSLLAEFRTSNPFAIKLWNLETGAAITRNQTPYFYQHPHNPQQIDRLMQASFLPNGFLRVLRWTVRPNFGQPASAIVSEGEIQDIELSSRRIFPLQKSFALQQRSPSPLEWASFSKTGDRLVTGTPHNHPFGLTCAEMLELNATPITTTALVGNASRRDVAVAISPDGHFAIGATLKELYLWELP